MRTRLVSSGPQTFRRDDFLNVIGGGIAMLSTACMVSVIPASHHPFTVVCLYCGGERKSDIEQCPGCGARKTKFGRP